MNTEEKEELRGVIIGTVHDLVANFMYYDRKEDEELSGDALEEAFRDGVVTVDEVVEFFRGGLEKSLGERENQKRYTLQEFKQYLSKQDSMGDIHYNLSKIDDYLAADEDEDEEE